MRWAPPYREEAHAAPGAGRTTNGQVTMRTGHAGDVSTIVIVNANDSKENP
jgi:hypothetical protein